MAEENFRYKTTIHGKPYTIIGHETRRQMDEVMKVFNDQLEQIKRLAPEISTEDSAVLLAVNAINDQLKKQERIFQLEEDLQAAEDKISQLTSGSKTKAPQEKR